MAPTPALNALNYANVIAYVVNAVVTFVSVTGVFGETNGFIAAKYQTIITPAGYAFGIWGVIFTGELLFVIAQCTSSVRATNLIQQGVGWSWVSACAFQSAWTFAFAQEKLVLSTVFIIGIFVSLAVGVKRSAALDTIESFDWVCRLPLCIHFAWLSAATVLNVNIVFVANGASPADQLACGLVSLALVLVNAALLASREFTGRAVTIGVAAWTLAAIGQELVSPMDKDICEERTGTDDCNMVSEIFDATTITGVQKTSYALAVVSVATFALVIVAGFTKPAASTTSSKLALPSTMRAPLIQY